MYTECTFQDVGGFRAYAISERVPLPLMDLFWVKVTTPEMERSSNSTPIFEGEMDKEDSYQKWSTCKDKCKVDFE